MRKLANKLESRDLTISSQSESIYRPDAIESSFTPFNKPASDKLFNLVQELKEKNASNVIATQAATHLSAVDPTIVSTQMRDHKIQKMAEVFINTCAIEADQKARLLEGKENVKKKKILRIFSSDNIGIGLPSKSCCWFNYTIKEHSPLYVIMMIMVHTAVLYNLYFIPLRWAFISLSLFPPNKYNITRHVVWGNSVYFSAFDILADFIYFLDIVLLQSHIQYTSDVSGEVIKDFKSTAKRYFTSKGFIFDVISLIYPLINEIFFFIICRENCVRYECCDNTITLKLVFCCILTHPLFRILRLLKLIKTYQLIEIIERKISWTQTFRIARALIQLLLHGHFLGCFFFIFFLEQNGSYEGIFQGFGNNGDVTNNPVIFSFYWGFLLATNIHNQPRPSSSVQYIWMVTCHMIGALHMAYLFAVFVSAFKIMNWHKNQFIIQSARSKRIFEIYPLLAGTKKHKVTEYYEYGFENHDELFENIVISYFPINMRLNLLTSNYGSVLRNCEIFKDMSDGFLRQIMLLMENRFFLPGEFIYQKNIQANEMYIVTKGLVSLIITLHCGSQHVAKNIPRDSEECPAAALCFQ